MRYPIILRRTETGFAVEVPDLSVCVTTGRTFEAAVANAREAILLHIEGLLEDSEPVPAASVRVELRIDTPAEIVTFLDLEELKAA